MLAHIPVQQAHAEVVMLDTARAADAWETGRDGPECRGLGGLRLVYDGTGSAPILTLSGPGGDVTLCGLAEIRTVARRTDDAARLAQAFGVPRTFAAWTASREGSPP
jgi:hypothetical protein